MKDGSSIVVVIVKTRFNFVIVRHVKMSQPDSYELVHHEPG